MGANCFGMWLLGMHLSGEAGAIVFPAGMHALQQGTSFLFQRRAHTTSFISLISSCNSSRTISKVEAASGGAGIVMYARKATRA